MSGLILSAPISGAAYTYAYRDTAGTWSAEAAMTKGVDRSEINFVMPVVADELRITMTCPAQIMGQFHLEGLNLTGLSFDLVDDTLTHSFTQTVRAQPKSTHRESFSYTPASTENATLTITGINQQKLNIDQLFFVSDVQWGEHCYSGINENTTHQYNSHDTRGFSGSTFFSGKESRSLSFELMEYSDYTDLKYFADHQLVDRFCLVQFSHTDDSQLAVIEPSGGQWSRGNYYSFNITVKEAYSE